jgi:hypothetical protein
MLERSKRITSLFVLLVLPAAALVVMAQDPPATPTKPKASQTGRCDPATQEPADLSGTYTGKVNYPDGGLTGEATLTITGNSFTLTSGSSNLSGKISAERTCGYIGATMMFGEMNMPKGGDAAPPLLPVISVRAKKMGKKLALMSVPGEKRTFSFGSMAAPRRKKPAPPAPSPTPPSQGL